MDIISTLRQFRIGQYSVFDFATAYLGLLLLAPLLTWAFSKLRLHIPMFSWLWFTLPLAVLFHIIFNQQTPFNKLIFDPNGYYIEKLVLVVMIVMGVRLMRVLPKVTP